MIYEVEMLNDPRNTNWAQRAQREQNKSRYTKVYDYVNFGCSLLEIE